MKPYSRFMQALKQRLTNWTDYDVAAYELGVVLGLLPEFGGDDPWHGTKWMFWSANPLGEALHDFLVELSKIGVLQMNDDGFRWNPDYSGPL
jgi:hypothetical protein